MNANDPTRAGAEEAIAPRARQLFDRHRREIFVRTDRLFAGLMAFQLAALVVAAVAVTPRTWSGASPSVHPHVMAAACLGGLIAALPIAAALRFPGRTATRHIVAASQMLIGALLIHLSGGRIETHFHIFGSLAFLAFYRDDRVLITAASVVALDHCLRGAYWPRSVFGVLTVQPWRWAEHTAWVVFEVLFLGWSCRRGIREMWAIADRQARLEAIHAQVEREAERRAVELREAEAVKATIVEAALDAILTTDPRGRILEVNSAALSLFGAGRDALVGRAFAELVRPAERRDPGRRGAGPELEETVADLVGRRVEVEAWRADGAAFAAEVTVSRIDLDGGPRFAAFVRDITERKRAESRLSHQARHDPLTGLSNRAEFQSRLERSLEGRDAEGPGTLAVMLIDLDRFKEINDTFGHHSGDQVLRQVGPRLRDVVGESGLVARLGGDEFGILLPGAGEAEAARLADAILAAIKPPMEVEGRMLEVGASVGIALAPGHGTDPTSLLQGADVAMYAAKRGGSGHLTYQPDQREISTRRMRLIGELRNAIGAGQLVFHYQPKVDLATREPVGVEALARWQHPREGLITPDQFIPLAEHSGLIAPLGHWALRAILDECESWGRLGLDGFNVAVNLSAANLADPEYAEAVLAQVERSGIAPGMLTVEVTETSLMTDPDRTRDLLGRLHRRGIRVAIDDFGTGYSSLGYLRDLAIDEVKIDRSFVAGLLASESQEAVVRAIINMAHELSLRVIAEGVEDERTAARLGALGCDLGQGFLFCRPLPPIQLLNWLQSSRRAATVA